MLFSSSVVSHSLPPMNCSMPGFAVLHRFPEVAQTHVLWVSEASLTWCIQTSDPLSSPSPPAFSLSQHQGLSQWIGSSHQVASDVASHVMGWGPFVFDPQGAFLPMCSVSPALRMGHMWPLDLLLKQNLACLCPCCDCYLKVSTGDKVQLLTLFLSFPSWRAICGGRTVAIRGLHKESLCWWIYSVSISRLQYCY